MILFLVFSGLCFGQVELVNNNWPTDPQGLKFFPDSKVSYVSRLTRTDGTGVSGVPYHYTIKQYAGQGFHTHETANGTVLSRPYAAFIPSTALPSGGENGTSDAQGYMVANVEFNNFAGWYTVCVTNAYGERCVNNNTRYFTQQNGYPLYLERYTGGLPPYESSNSVNRPQSQHVDSRHSVSSAPESQNLSYIFEGYTTRWVTHDAHLRLLAMSSQYKTLTAQQNVADLLDLTRASLPDGGIYDNDVAGVAPGNGNTTLDWDTRVYEEHQHGVEADVVVPSGTLRQDIFFAGTTSSGCYLGKYKPTSELIYTGTGLSEQTQIENFWRTQGVAHVSCKPGQALRGGNRPPPFAK